MQQHAFATFLFVAAASQYCGSPVTEHNAQTARRSGSAAAWPRVESRGRSRDPGSVFGHIITNRKLLQTSHTAPLPPFVYRVGWGGRGKVLPLICCPNFTLPKFLKLFVPQLKIIFDNNSSIFLQHVELGDILSGENLDQRFTVSVLTFLLVKTRRLFSGIKLLSFLMSQISF